ncbi:gamma-glutamylcyclotransferase family protein [Natrinema salinisoli]|uniref:gamma-glutamylcyclotransferase family protein n=1 Tax=Natrinema salinisoli TaxID=2878535 RepID=UPI001CF03CD8|nr:gamma-glutamylcyclotransferase family protein [Natrinema salinisoli]
MEALVADDLDSLEKRREKGSVIGYGSLIHPEEITAEFEDLNPVSIPFRLEGYKRIFNQRSSWRDPEKAVLNVQKDPEAWCNVILIVFQDATRPENYEEREEGYHFEQVAVEQLHPYISAHQSALNNIDWIEIPIGDRVESDIEPLHSYVNRCLEGAEWWSRQLEMSAETESDNSFLEDFIHTTGLEDGSPFIDYIRQNKGDIQVDTSMISDYSASDPFFTDV